jgi:uncharacterized Zn finger protein
MISNLSEFDFNLVIATARHIIHVQFNEEEIENSCCDCPAGDRKVGVCSHRAATIWFLAYQRHCNETSAKQSSGSYITLPDDSELVDDFVESSDEDDNFLYTLP